MGSADFYEAFKRHRESEKARANSDESIVRPDDTDSYSEDTDDYQEDYPSGEVDNFPDYEDDSNLLEAISEPSTEATVSSIHMHSDEVYSQARYSGHLPSHPEPRPSNLISMKNSTLFFSLIVIGLGIVLSYMIGQEQGRGNPLLDTSGDRQTLSIVRPGNTTTVRNSEDVQQPQEQEVQKQYILVLCTYDINKSEIARLTLKRLQEGGFPKLDLAKDSKHIYLYSGPYEGLADAALVDYQNHFKSQPDFSKCFVKTVIMR
ncbi:MAG: hypothetical protein O3B01_18990 [Planctomycetota bacterium]|nr:hypothetical protein [Planctomycetota bacterium]MDA1140659.1 hypothetical protein [Planctomycetota bacterium]